MKHVLTDANFLIYAAQNYSNRACNDPEEFIGDLKKFQYLAKLFKHYEKSGELKPRLIMNHIIVLYNVFEPIACTRMLFLKLGNYIDCLIPFLDKLGYLGEYIYDIREEGFIYIPSIKQNEEIKKWLSTQL